MSTIGPGTLLICVSDGNPPAWVSASDRVTVGALYMCEVVRDNRRGELCPTDQCGITGVELVGKKHGALYCPNMFKPFIDGLDEEIEQEIKEPEHA